MTWRTTGWAGRRPGVGSSYSPTVRPVTSATAARMRSGVTSRPGRVGGARIDHVQLGVGARAALAGAGGEHQPRRLQAGQQLRGGRLRQAGELADPGPGQRAVREQQVEGGAVVHGAQDAWGARRTGGSCHVCRHLPFAAQLLSVAAGKSTGRSLLGRFPIRWEESRPAVRGRQYRPRVGNKVVTWRTAAETRPGQE